ncbi:hypothetical protein ACN47E_008427 [Coniothyrium glycines]
MRLTTFITATAFSSAVLAASAVPQDDVASILQALRENNPEDADAAASVMKIKLRRDPAPVPQSDDLNSILAALEANNPEDAAAARQAPSSSTLKRQVDDLNTILAELEANNPEDAAAARQASSVQKRWEA